MYLHNTRNTKSLLACTHPGYILPILMIQARVARINSLKRVSSTECTIGYLPNDHGLAVFVLKFFQPECCLGFA